MKLLHEIVSPSTPMMAAVTQGCMLSGGINKLYVVYVVVIIMETCMYSH